MKKFKKINHLMLFSLVVIALVMIPTTLVILGGDPPCPNPGGTVGSAGYDGTKQKVLPKIPTSGYEYYEWGNGGSGAKITYASDSLGVSVSFNVFETQEEVNNAKRLGMCNDECVTSKSLGLEGNRTTWGKQIEEAGKSEGKKWEKFCI